MTKESVLEKQYQVQAEIPLAFMRFLETRTDERVLEVVLVYNGVDRFDTVIEPTGMRTDPNVVTVDYNHKGVNTGAYLRNVRIEENYKIENGETLERALVGDIHIPKDSEMFYTTREGEKKSNGNLYEAVTKGQVRSVSVEFKPYLGKQITDTKTGITTFREWDLLRLSLLDVTPGQPYSGIKITRSLIQTNQPNMQRSLNNLVKKDGKIAVITKEVETEENNTKTTVATLTYLDGTTEDVTWQEGEDLEDENMPFEWVDVGEYVLSQIAKTTTSTEQATTDTTQRSESKIEIKVGEPTGEGTDTAPKEGEGEETPPAPAEADQNGDGELSDSEVRSYIKELKRSYDSPAMISEKLGELERSFGEINERMNSMITAGQTKTETDKSEAEMQRHYETTLSDIPNEAESQVSGDMKRQLDPAEKPKVEPKRFTLEDMQAAELKAKLYHK
jgi:hypothetical protein